MRLKLASTINRITQYEAGELTPRQVTLLMRDLFNSGVIMHLQGMYQRAFNDEMKAGRIALTKGGKAIAKRQTDDDV